MYALVTAMCFPTRPAHEPDLFEPEVVEPFDALSYLFTTRTVAAARAVAEALGRHTEVWEFRGRYYPTRRGSNESEILCRAGAERVPPADDDLHMALDPLLAALQRAGGETG